MIGDLGKRVWGFTIVQIGKLACDQILCVYPIAGVTLRPTRGLMSSHGVAAFSEGMEKDN